MDNYELSKEKIEDDISLIFAANLLTKDGFFFRVVPSELNALINRAYQIYPDLCIDMEIVNHYIDTLSAAPNAITLVKNAVDTARNSLYS